MRNLVSGNLWITLLQLGLSEPRSDISVHVITNDPYERPNSGFWSHVIGNEPHQRDG